MARNRPGWMPMRRSEYLPLTEEQIDAHLEFVRQTQPHATREDVARIINSDDEVWRNNRYQCAVRYVDPVKGRAGGMHLSIKRIDKKPIRDWRIMQRIKNEVAGPEREAMELFPAESRLVDTANQYHLWVTAEGVQIPVGWTERFVDGSGNDRAGFRQRPLDD